MPKAAHRARLHNSQKSLNRRCVFLARPTHNSSPVARNSERCCRTPNHCPNGDCSFKQVQPRPCTYFVKFDSQIPKKVSRDTCSALYLFCNQQDASTLNPSKTLCRLNLYRLNPRLVLFRAFHHYRRRQTERTSCLSITNDSRHDSSARQSHA